VNGYLLDVNALIALVREDHVAHKRTKHWFQHSAARNWATCTLTQAGFVRIISNPRFLEHAPDISEALDMLRVITELPGHRFWAADVNFIEAVEPIQERLFGHQQVTDAYLLGLTVKKKGKLATLDRAVKMLAGSELNQYLEIIE
jgi:toxin-antitoxin system PIN domain toxin